VTTPKKQLIHEVWHAFRSKRWIDIASDGGLTGQTGTFGWKIYDTTRKRTLFTGAGPIDGPFELNRSTRSEFGGYAAPLLLITLISRFWGLRHRSKFYWIVDSKSAIAKVKMYSGSSENHPYPDHCDYISLIRELQRELRRPIKTIWVKGHQDDQRSYDDLPQQAILNIDADNLATQYFMIRKQRPTSKIPHLPDQQISLSINGQRFPGHLESNLRWHINGTYMRIYLQRRRGWSDNTWKLIDFDSFGGLCKSLTPTQQISHSKFVNDLQLLGSRKAKYASTIGSSEVAIDTCPCCNKVPESPFHLLQCLHNPARTQAILEFSDQTVKKAADSWELQHFATQ
jgi:hypothetical protein